MFVEVLIEGNILKNAIAVPRDAMRNSNEVWVAKDGQLCIQVLDIVRADRDFAYARSGLEDGDMIVVSSLDMVIEGMKVRVQTEPAATFAEVSRDARLGEGPSRSRETHASKVKAE
jgi:multidrug efflux pump subunit AcrA (membrane-fusion protein)